MKPGPAANRLRVADLITSVGRRSPLPVARFDRIGLASYAGATSRDVVGNAGWLEGVGPVVAGRHVFSSTSLRVTPPVGYSGVSYIPDIDARRVASLCESFASWLRREMTL